jgi:hypothetical protein
VSAMKVGAATAHRMEIYCGASVAIGTSRHFAAPQNLVAIGGIADIDQSVLTSLNLQVHASSSASVRSPYGVASRRSSRAMRLGISGCVEKILLSHVPASGSMNHSAAVAGACSAY